MEPLAQRIRWGNVAAAAAVLALVALIVAWPRLAPRPAQLPPASAVPVAPDPPTPRPPLDESAAEPAPSTATTRGPLPFVLGRRARLRAL
jgi:hypothetical protein